MKFDTMLCNPPYQLGKNSNFYREFIVLSKDVVNEDIVFIVPNRFCMNGSKTTNLLNEFQLHHIMWNSSDHFPKVGTFIGSYIASNSDNPDNTQVPVDFGEFDRTIDLTKDTLPPKPIHDETKISIIKKYLDYPDKCEIVKSRSDDTVFICRQWTSWVPDDGTKTGIIFNIKKEESTDGKIYLVGNPDRFKWFVSRSLFMRFISRNFASGMFVAPQVAKNIPDIGYEEPLTDQLIYERFGLSDSEIEYLENEMYK